MKYVLAILLATLAVTAVQAEETRVLQLEEMWRIGGPDDEENLLGVIDRVLVDDDNNVYLLDIQLVEVQVFDPDGEYVQSLGKQGDGPGEVRRASEILFMPDGTLGLVQPFPGRIVTVALDGTPAGEVRPGEDDPTEGGFFFIGGAATLGDRLVLSGARSTRDEDRMTSVNFLEDFPADGTAGTVFYQSTTVRQRAASEVQEKDRYFPHRAWTLGPDGRLYLAPERNAYRIEVFGAVSEPERTMKREYQSWKRTPQEMERLEQQSAVGGRGRNRNRPDFVFEATEPDITALHAAPDGSLWVLTSRGTREQPEGIHSTWDVFDAAGDFTGQVAFACEGRG